MVKFNRVQCANYCGSARCTCSRPFVFSKFVTTLDGAVSLRVRGHANGADIGGCSGRDRMVMGLLRTVADVVIVGSRTLAADRQHVWTAEAICPELAREYGRLRKALGKSGAPLNVVVSGSGLLNLRLPVFSSGQVPVLIVTTVAGAKRLARQRIRPAVEIRAIHRSRSGILASEIFSEVCRVSGVNRVLVEGGPRLLGDCFAQSLVSDQFLTLAPQIAGRDESDRWPGLVMEQLFAPSNPLWGSLTDVRRGASHFVFALFLRLMRGQPSRGGRISRFEGLRIRRDGMVRRGPVR